MHHQKVPRIRAFKHFQAPCHLKHEDLECKQQRCNEASNILWQYNAEFNHRPAPTLPTYLCSNITYFSPDQNDGMWPSPMSISAFSHSCFIFLIGRRKTKAAFGQMWLFNWYWRSLRESWSLGMWFPKNQYFLLTSWKHWDLLKYRFGLVRMRNVFVFEVINIHLEKKRMSLHIRCRKFIQIYKVSHLSFIHINVLQHTAHWPRQLYIKLE